MPVVLTSDERKRLAKLAGMLGPNSDGERLNALSFIQKLADQKKVRIDELLLASQTEIVREVVRWREPPPASKPWGASQPAEEVKVDPDWRDQLREALDHDEGDPFMTPWEANFATDILSRKFSQPTEKQAAAIARILEKRRKRNAA